MIERIGFQKCVRHFHLSIKCILKRVSSSEGGALAVDGVPVETYVTRFAWDEGRYPTMSPLKDIVNKVHGLVAKIEDDMKVRAQFEASSMPSTGSKLDLCDLFDMVKEEDIIATEHLETLLTVVPKYSQKDWLSSYETLTQYVVPRSSKKLHEDNEYALYTVTLFKKMADNFKIDAREKGFQASDSFLLLSLPPSCVCVSKHEHLTINFGARPGCHELLSSPVVLF